MKKCPACSSALIEKIVEADPSAPVQRGPVAIDVCSVCGGLWFEKGEVEAIPYSKLPELVAKEKVSMPVASVNACPECGALLRPLRAQNLPREVEARFCPACRGTFFSPTDLVKYKKAQMSKIAYFRNFHIPLPSTSLLLTSVVGLLLVGSFAGALFFNRRFDNRTRAARLVSKPFVTVLPGGGVTLTFTTQEPATSKIEISAPYIVSTRVLPVANTLTTLHQITVEDLRPATEYSYRLILYDEDNVKITSEKFTFRTPQH